MNFYKFWNEFWDHYSLLLPYEVYEHKIGTCWDQTIFENYVFDHQLKYEHKMIFIQQFLISTHTFLVLSEIIRGIIWNILLTNSKEYTVHMTQ